VIARADDGPHDEGVGEKEAPRKRRKRTNETPGMDIVTDSRRGFRAVRHCAGRANFETGIDAEVDEEKQEEQKVDGSRGCAENFAVEVVSRLRRAGF
jgi:hypothetical protein